MSSQLKQRFRILGSNDRRKKGTPSEKWSDWKAPQPVQPRKEWQRPASKNEKELPWLKSKAQSSKGKILGWRWTPSQPVQLGPIEPVSADSNSPLQVRCWAIPQPLLPGRSYSTRCTNSDSAPRRNEYRIPVSRSTKEWDSGWRSRGSESFGRGIHRIGLQNLGSTWHPCQLQSW